MSVSTSQHSQSSGYKRRRPQGLWQSRTSRSKRPKSNEIAPTPPTTAALTWDSESADSEFEDDFDCRSLSSKRRRLSSHAPRTSEADSRFCAYGLGASCECRISGWVSSTKVMDTCSLASRGIRTSSASSVEYDDWEDLKDLFRKASQELEGDDAQTLPLLRGVVHECHRMLLHYDDPSVLFNPLLPSRDGHHRHVDLPTAFYSVLGASLFLIGNLIGRTPTLALSGEPTFPTPYWLAALDAFETGVNLPRLTSSKCDFDIPEDWDMAITWGRTLVALAHELISPTSEADPNFNWPPSSPMAMIASIRPPSPRPLRLSSVTPNDLMELAMDQFSRGILNMPHFQQCFATTSAPTTPAASADNFRPVLVFPLTRCPTPTHVFDESTNEGPPSQRSVPHSDVLIRHVPTFSRARYLYAISTEVLQLAECMPTSAQRRTWAMWADSVLNQMRMEADMVRWRAAILRKRGRCWLIVGSTYSETVEIAVEADSNDDAQTLSGGDAKKARDALTRAIEFLERVQTVHGSGSSASSASSSIGDEDEEEEELHALMSEAFVSLANLTPDEVQRERLYERAVEVGGDAVKILLES